MGVVRWRRRWGWMGGEWPKKGGARAAVVPPDHRPVPCHHLEKPHIMNEKKTLQDLKRITNYVQSHTMVL